MEQFWKKAFQTKKAITLALIENLQNEQKQQIRPYLNESLHKLVELSGSGKSEARCVAPGIEQNICSIGYTYRFLGTTWFPKCII